MTWDLVRAEQALSPLASPPAVFQRRFWGTCQGFWGTSDYTVRPDPEETLAQLRGLSAISERQINARN